MKVVTNKFLAWLMSLTTIMRYFVIALLLHVAAAPVSLRLTRRLRVQAAPMM